MVDITPVSFLLLRNNLRQCTRKKFSLDHGIRIFKVGSLEPRHDKTALSKGRDEKELLISWWLRRTEGEREAEGKRGRASGVTMTLCPKGSPAFWEDRGLEPLHIGLWGTLKTQIMVDKPKTSEKHTISQTENRKGVALRGGERNRS